MRKASAGWTLALSALLLGCGGSRSLELTGDEVRKRLPEEVSSLVPADAILCHDEEGQHGAYRLWILRKPAGSRIEYPKRRGLEHHAMPTTALESLLRSRLPSLDSGTPVDRHCHYTHWRATDGSEIQVREIVTDQGWFASVERVRM
ncbi:MAG: hypothetical protein U0794_02060 [Isosphaeraceae bacterium]